MVNAATTLHTHAPTTSPNGNETLDNDTVTRALQLDAEINPGKATNPTPTDI